MTVALSQWSVVAWWVTLGIGLIVAAVVTALLEVLRRTVTRVEDAVEQVLWAGGAVAQNTQTTHLLHTTKARGAELVTELTPQRAEGGPP